MLKPENAVRFVSIKMQNYEKKELETLSQNNKDLVNEYNKLVFEVQQREKHFQNLQDQAQKIDYNNKESLAYEKRAAMIMDKMNWIK